eukprot:scaffold19506_cov68-Phaeocystis_antarctica.AAC.3
MITSGLLRYDSGWGESGLGGGGSSEAALVQVEVVGHVWVPAPRIPRASAGPWPCMSSTHWSNPNPNPNPNSDPDPNPNPNPNPNPTPNPNPNPNRATAGQRRGARRQHRPLAAGPGARRLARASCHAGRGDAPAGPAGAGWQGVHIRR